MYVICVANLTTPLKLKLKNIYTKEEEFVAIIQLYKPTLYSINN